MALLDDLKKEQHKIFDKIEPPLCPVCNDLMNLPIRIYTHQSKEKTLWHQCFCGVILNANPIKSEKKEHIKNHSKGGWKYRDAVEYYVHVYFPLIEELTYGRKILEVGYCLPYILRKARDRGWIVTGMDTDVARKNERGIEIIQDDFETHNFKYRKYDLIWMGHVLKYFKDWKAAIEKIYSLLRPEGVCFVASPDVGLISKIGMMNWGHWDLRHRMMFSGERFKAEMERIGFKSILLRQNETLRFGTSNDFHGIWQKPYYDEPYIGGYDHGVDFDQIKEFIKQQQEGETK